MMFSGISLIFRKRFVGFFQTGLLSLSRRPFASALVPLPRQHKGLSSAAWVLIFGITIGLGACQKTPASLAFKGVDITGTPVGSSTDGKPGFALQDAAGRTRSLADYRGKAVLVFFGYTHCPDVCPTVLATLAQTLPLLDGAPTSPNTGNATNAATANPSGAKASDQVQVLFITVDPARDTPAVMTKYASAFDSRFVGLRGSDAATREAVSHFKGFYQIVPGTTPENYTVDHTGGIYGIDRQGQLRVFIRQNVTPPDLAHDIKVLLARG